jgi:hypothetical protein
VSWVRPPAPPPVWEEVASTELDGGRGLRATAAIAKVGLYPIVTFQYSSTTLFQVSYHNQSLFF